MVLRWLAPLLLLASLATVERTFQVDDFAAADDRTTINRAFAAMRTTAGVKRLRFSARTYVIASDPAAGATPLLDLADVRDLDLDGNGAVIEARDMLDAPGGYLLGVRAFADVRIRDLRITYRPLPFVQGRITAVDQAVNRVEVELVPGFDGIGSLRRHATAELWCRVGQPAEPHLPKAHSPSWLAVGDDGAGGVRREARGGGRWLLHAGGFDPARTIGGRHTWTVGDPLVVWQRGAQDALAAWDGAGLRLEGIAIDSALHFAIKVRGVTGVAITGCRIEPGPGAWFSVSADGIDVQQCRDVSVRGCRVVANGDDGISFLNHGHGHNGTTVETRFPPPLPETNEEVRIEDCHLEGGNRNGILLLAHRSLVTGNVLRHIRQYGVKCGGDDAVISGNRFEAVGSFTPWSHIADELETGIVCSDMWTQHRWTVRGNRFTGCYHMPALLLRALAGTVVEDNRIEVEGRDADDLRPHAPSVPRPVAIRIASGSFRGAPTRATGIILRRNQVVGAGLAPLQADPGQEWSGELPVGDR